MVGQVGEVQEWLGGIGPLKVALCFFDWYNKNEININDGDYMVYNKNIEECVSQLNTFSSLHRQYLNGVLKRIHEYYGDLLLGLSIFGSYARRENRKNSDLDLLIILKKVPGFSQRIREFVDNVELELESLAQKLYEEEDILCELSPYILSKEESLKFHPIYFDLVEYNKVVYDPEGIISHIIESTKNLMVRNGAKKVEYGNFWEWETEKGEFLGGTQL
ncbi:nucleotidyltransferase family protein [Thermoanaerobacterium sp. DL9XJH110]|uniref:nucleotidyltransferase domain-containing protein n=1 Tax=Thermoanaerobacterium sp. DL9XJH110 TaxID=3386643 RepID=UPI003BB561D6